MLPRRNNPYLPCGEGSEWVLSLYGHMTVLDKEVPLSNARKVLIAATMVLGIFHIVAVLWLYRKYRKDITTNIDYQPWDRKALLVILLAGIGRYYHFIDNHLQPAAYHDGDLIYCATMFADTDAFLPFQIIHILVGLYATNAIFKEKCVTKTTYHAVLVFGAISCIGLLHYIIEPVTFFAFPQQMSILGEAISGFLLMYWGSIEHNQYTGSAEEITASSFALEYLNVGRHGDEEGDPLVESNAGTSDNDLLRIASSDSDLLRNAFNAPLCSIRRRSKEINIIK